MNLFPTRLVELITDREISVDARLDRLEARLDLIMIEFRELRRLLGKLQPPEPEDDGA